MDTRVNRIAAPARVCIEARFTAKRGRQGQAIVEFALAAPVLLTLVLGMMVFGIALNNYVALTFAANAAAQQLSISRGQTTDPCNTTSQAVYSAAPQLQKANLTFSIVLNGKSDGGASCPGKQTDLVQSQPAVVTVTYPCKLIVLGVNFAPGCTLRAQNTLLIQ